MFREQDTNKHFRLCQCGQTGNANDGNIFWQAFNQKLFEGEVTGTLYEKSDNEQLFSSF